MAQHTDRNDDSVLDNLVLNAPARFTVEEAQARRDAFNATVSLDDL